MTESARWVPDF